MYVPIKLLIFDIDTYLLSHITPGYQWVLNLRLFAIASLLAILWLALGHKRFLVSVTYVTAYPLIVLFWKLPKLVVRQWALLVVLLPTIYGTVVSLRSTFVLYTAAAVSVVFIVLSSRPAFLVLPMVYLAVFLIIILHRAFRRALSPNVFSQLADLIREFPSKIGSGDYDPAPVPSVASDSRAAQGQEEPQTAQMSQFYILYVLADFVAEKVAWVAKDRKYSVLLVLSFLNVVVLTTIVFGLLNWGLYRTDASSFGGVRGGGFFEFLAFSLGQLASTNLTSIQPISSVAIILSAVEVLASLIIIVILAFSILTAARDAYSEGFQGFSQALHETAGALDQRIMTKYSLTVEQLEASIATESVVLVNMLRRLRGLPELPAPAHGGRAGEALEHSQEPQG